MLALAGVLGCAGQGRVPATASAERGASAPADLVDVRDVASGVTLDLRYATPENFTGVVVYPAARCLLRRSVAEALARVQARLAAAGYGLRVWDCYRPFAVQERFWALVPDERYVARPVRSPDGNPLKGSKHSRGAAVDVTLVDAGGRPVPMPTGFDDFGAAAHRGSGAGGAEAQANAQRLSEAMVAEGFEPFPTEWWHFDARGWRTYELLDVPFDAIPAGR
jgi:beta-N-acetylhexosaminidase/D-alanyl-D-alanine dipeptidase